MHTLTRRQWLQTTGAAAAAVALTPRSTPAQGAAGFTLPPLPYPPNALEPHIDTKTMEIHHGKHHAAYVTNLNNALKGHLDLLSKPIEELIRSLNQVPQNVRTAVRNNGGGHYNHSMFWQIMGPHAGGEPTGPLGDAIKKAFGDFAKFRDAFKAAAMGQFGSGWAWLTSADGKLAIDHSANQDSPLSEGKSPILGIDVWEHAYYLKYQNRRADYVDAWWNVVNWKAAAERFGRKA
jgi:Fe-Mn family superoxide dismutase